MKKRTLLLLTLLGISQFSQVQQDKYQWKTKLGNTY